MNSVATTPSEKLQKTIEPDVIEAIKELGVLHYEHDDLETVMEGNKKVQCPSVKFQHKGYECTIIYKAKRNG